jgi:hypothetical protein
MTSMRKIPPNRTVAALTPLVFAPLAGAISVAAAKYAPGVTIDEGSLEAIFIAGATIAFGNAGLWTKGWQAQEQRDAEMLGAAAGGDAGDASFADDLDDLPDPTDAGFEDAGDPALDGLDEDSDGDSDGDIDDDDLDLDLDFDEDDELVALTAAPEE